MPCHQAPPKFRKYDAGKLLGAYVGRWKTVVAMMTPKLLAVNGR